MLPLVIVGLFVLLAGAVVVWQIRRRNMDRWLIPYLLQTPRRRPPAPTEDVHVLICIADHYEPKFQNPTAEVARERVRRWHDEYPRKLGGYRDSDGRKPRHTFFYPAEEYEPEYLDALTELCALGHGEIEIHLHHDNDTATSLREKLVTFRDTLAHQHGLLARHRETGEVAYAFIHGNWALCNSRKDGRYCGVNEEIDILRETGCYADLTMPSAPSSTQSAMVNKLYYATNQPGRSRSHDTGVEVGTAPQPPNSLMLIQGPLLLDWTRRKWGIFPRLENGCLQRSQPPSLERLMLWIRARVQVPTRPDWFFVKLYCHGTIEEDSDVVGLGEGKAKFHEALAAYAQANPRFHYHYVTAREMYNLIRAAESGWKGSVADALDFELLPGPALTRQEAPTPAAHQQP